MADAYVIGGEIVDVEDLVGAMVARPGASDGAPDNGALVEAIQLLRYAAGGIKNDFPDSNTLYPKGDMQEALQKALAILHMVTGTLRSSATAGNFGGLKQGFNPGEPLRARRPMTSTRAPAKPGFFSKLFG